MGKNTSSEISLPQSVSMTITTKSKPASRVMSRYLTFENFKNEVIRLKIELTRKSDSSLEVTGFPDSLHNLQVLGSLNHRSYWDKVYLENRGGNTEIEIARISMTIKYVKVSGGCEKEIPLLNNRWVNRTLKKDSRIWLSGYMASDLRKWAKLSPSAHKVARMAVADLGKSGTSDKGFDNFADNPKYKGAINNECSEFVSWYLHEAGLRFGPLPGLRNISVFKNITATQKIHDIFKALKKSYAYNNAKKQFINESTGRSYTPKAGDWVGRRGGGKAEHSMIMLKWDSRKRIATVINGPYPVTLREVKVHELETRDDDPKDFIVGAVW